MTAITITLIATDDDTKALAEFGITPESFQNECRDRWAEAIRNAHEARSERRSARVGGKASW